MYSDVLFLSSMLSPLSLSVYPMSLKFYDVEYIMSGFVAIKYIRLPIILLNSVGSTIDPSSSFLNFKLVITGVGVVLQLDILNIFKTSLAYFVYDIKIPLSEC